jgi:hypothetical protein
LKIAAVKKGWRWLLTEMLLKKVVLPQGHEISILPQTLGYPVNYVKFNGEHQIPANISANAVKWFIEQVPTFCQAFYESILYGSSGYI